MSSRCEFQMNRTLMAHDCFLLLNACRSRSYDCQHSRQHCSLASGLAIFGELAGKCRVDPVYLDAATSPTEFGELFGFGELTGECRVDPAHLTIAISPSSRLQNRYHWLFLPISHQFGLWSVAMACSSLVQSWLIGLAPDRSSAWPQRRWVLPFMVDWVGFSWILVGLVPFRLVLNWAYWRLALPFLVVDGLAGISLAPFLVRPRVFAWIRLFCVGGVDLSPFHWMVFQFCAWLGLFW